MLKFRYVKMELQDGSWRTFYPINENQLNKKIKLLHPKNCYVSVNKWLRYEEHPRYRHQNKLMEKQALIDIDGQEFESPEHAKGYFSKILGILKENNICIDEVVQTNSTLGGYQILIKPCCTEQFFDLKNHLLSVFDRIDSRVFDLKRIRRLPNTWNGNKKSYSVSLVLPDCLENHPLMVSGNRETQSLGMALVKPNDKFCAQKRNNSDIKTKGRTKIKSNLPSHFYVKELSNSVNGLKNCYIPVLKFWNKPSKRRLLRLQKTYNLGDLYFFKTHLGYMAICPKICSRERLLKIYQAVKCFSCISELNKYRQNWMFVSNIFDSTKQKIDTFKFLFCLSKETKGWFSYGHLKFLNKYIDKDYSNVIGNEQKVFVAEFKS